MRLRLLAAVCLPLSLAAVLAAQKPPVLAPTVFAVTDARVVTAAGRVLPKATVVVRDGLIEAVGPDAAAPPDALVTDGKGLTVYPGFIDALSAWGYDAALKRSTVGAPAADDLASETLTTTKPDNRKGVTPEFAVRAALKDDEQADAWRKAGVTAHLVAPDGGYVTGQSALVSLSGLPPREAVLRSPVALHAALRTQPGGPGNDGYPRSLMGVVAHVRQTFLDADHYDRARRAYRHVGLGRRRPPEDPSLAALGLALPLDGRPPELPTVFEADTADAIDRALDFAREFGLKPVLFGGRDAWKLTARLKAEGVPVLVRLDFAEPGEREGELPKRARDDLKRKRTEEVACAAALHKAGVAFAFAAQGLAADKFLPKLRQAIDAGLPADAALAALTAAPARLFGVEGQLGTVAAGKAAHLVVTDGDFQAAETRVRLVFADGVRFEYPAPPKADNKAKDSLPAAEPIPVPPREDVPGGELPEPATELDSDRTPRLRTGGNCVVRNATVLTVTRGTLANCDVLVKGGKIAAVGPKLDAGGVAEIDATGLFVMPGIVDTHCHFAVAGGVNEFSLSVVPEVRVRDVVDSEDVQIFRALAGGVTTARLLHGSANVIGGQDAVVKLKYGKPARQLLVADAPRGVKFALGENVKRTNGRFPNTRLGVEAVLVRAFTDASAYDAIRAAQLGNQEMITPLSEKAAGKYDLVRRDLRLEALSEVISGKIKVHCHCYRADEILMLLRTADRFGVKIQSLQHVLEGYKIAPEIAAHGASCSLFSDWWAYKIEAFDAIPYAAALLHEAGAGVCLKSDDNELMRHMYQEAAKLVKYGGMDETEALKTVTLNGAKQLGLEGRIGSIEVGKDADLAVFNGHPLNGYSRPELTLVEGEVYFQRADKPKPAAVAQAGPGRAGPRVKQAKPPAIVTDPNGRYEIAGVTVHLGGAGPVPGPASVFVAGGKIAEPNTDAAKGPTVIDFAGLNAHVYPGLIDAGTVVGLTELESAQETIDHSESGDFQPDLRASSGINPDSELIPVTRANGVLTVVTQPTGTVIAGQSALVNLAGWTPREMAVLDPFALHVEFPAVSPNLRGFGTAPFTGGGVTKKIREEKVRRFKELFEQAKAYDKARQAGRASPNPRLEALVPYARGVKPVVVKADKKAEIMDALKLADELKFRLILSGAIDAWKVIPEIKKRNVAVIYGPVMSLPTEKHDPYDAPMTTPAKLHEAGVKFCIRSAGGSNTRNLPYEAAAAAAYGLPSAVALDAVTRYPAEILGVDDQLGTVEPGQRANLVVTTGDILQPSTRVLCVVIDGRPFPPESKQTRLYERYRERLREFKAGRVPLGTK